MPALKAIKLLRYSSTLGALLQSQGFAARARRLGGASEEAR